MSSDEAALVLVLQVYRSTGEREEITIQPSQKLSDLKDAIASSVRLGRVPSADQRLFYLGRELKTPNRSLATLLGQHAKVVNVIHFMAIRRTSSQPPHPPPEQRTTDSDDEATESEDHGFDSCDYDDYELNESDDNDGDDDDIVVLEGGSKRVVTIDLASDESDSDEVEVVSPPKKSRAS